VDPISGTSTTDAASPASSDSQPAGAAPTAEPEGFRSRGSARRRARFLRKARELGYRDLGGLVFNLHRFGQRNDALVLAKLTTLNRIDTELYALEGMLVERRPVTVLREAGITACPRCAAIHSSEDNFCPNCGFSMRRNLDLPIAAPVPTAAAPVPTQASPATPPPSTPPPSPTPETTPAAVSTPATPPIDSATPAGRSPTPTGSGATGPSKPPSQAPTPSNVEDGPTEILGPPLPGS
jgi:hypothetical protein